MAKGVDFLAVVLDDDNYERATMAYAEVYGDTEGFRFPTTIDPDGYWTDPNLGASVISLPFNYILDLETMKIVDVATDPGAIASTLDSYL